MRTLVATSGLALVATSTALLSSPAQAADPVEVNVLATNDFHGRIAANGVEAGAPVLAGAVEQIRAAHPNTVFAAAGDLIGASTFESFIAHDKPTIDALNAAGLDVSAVGNHEFDQGYDDLVNRVMAPESPSNPNGGAQWQYLGANVVMKATGDPAVPATWVKDMGGVQVGFVGAVTEHLPELVSPAGIADIEVKDIVSSVNQQADALKADGVDVVVMLVHEGAPSTDCAAMDDDPTSDFGSIVTGVDANVDAIVSGHTHLAYNCSFPVAGWAGRPVTQRPVVSAGQYGYNLNQLDFSVDPASGQVLGVDTGILPLTTKNADGTYTPNYPADPAVQQIVDEAKANADVLGAQPLGQITGPFKRAQRPTVKDPSVLEENRGGESTLGNLVAEAQRWATESETSGSAQIAFMNPGGLRTDMLGTGDAYPKTVTYKQAANVQPFANTLVNMTMTGAQIAQALEQQWQPTGASRPFLRLGTSQGFTYSYDPVAKKISRMWLDGQPMSADQTYSVTVNSFLASGGDNFGAFKLGTDRRDTGKIDLSAMVDYMAAFAKDAPLAVDSSQHAVGVTFPTDAPTGYEPADTVSFQLSSLAMTGAGDVQDGQVSVALGGQQLGTFPVDNTVAPGNTGDEPGTASVSVRLPADTPAGEQVLLVTGDHTGTTVRVPVTVLEPTPVAMHVKVTPQKVWAGQTRPTVHVVVAAADGSVQVTADGKSYTAAVSDGEATLRLAAFGSAGRQPVVVRYRDTDGVQRALETVMVTVSRR